MRWFLALTGLALLGYGAVLAWEFAGSRTVNAVQGAAWFVGGPIVHDGLVAPVVGLVLTGVLTLLGVPLLWRPYGGATNPGLHDRDYGTGLAIALGIVWATVVIAGLAQQHRSRLALGRDQSGS